MSEFKGYFIDATSFTGKLDTTIVEIQPQYESIEIIPTRETQIKEGSYNKVIVAGEENLKAENISKGVSIFGVQGVGNMTNAKITNCSYLFYMGARTDYIQELISLCENVTSTKNMFYSCSTLETIDLSNFDTSNVTDMQNMFTSCSNLKSINLSNFNTKKVTNAQQMFYGCSQLETLDLSSFEFDSVSNINYFASSLRKLVNFKSPKNIGKGFVNKTENYINCVYKLSDSTKLTHESLLDVINNLYDLNLTYDVANGGTLYRQSLQLGSTNLAKLTAEEIAIATNKGWNVT